MDFVAGLPQTSRGVDSIWVIVDRLTKSAYFLPVHSSFSAERLAHIYFREVVRLTFQDELGTRVDLSRAFHPQINGQSERTIQILKYNNNYHSSIQMALLEALYGKHCRSPVGWFESTEPRPQGTNLIHEALV
ncbi:hypothetical protein MTR67_026237 [Solanum verrucosum]|uniref:Integrase catalytic domain-containing protein n=1 Tax=Solanum verrucosum TaxID=315347 RepID=A0AAF0R2K6_SOLVR|nr:hypothetical protein MTR67_026237 [Solanum verrucosum]